MKSPETLREWVKRKLAETGYSHAMVAKRAKLQGHKLSAGYVNNLAQGDADNPSAKVMKAIAAGFGVSLDEVIDTVFGKPISAEESFKESIFATLWQAYKQLPPEIQKEKKSLIEMLIREIKRET
jgi:transcriptional regulator with XRE-family HTH domain